MSFLNVRSVPATMNVATAAVISVLTLFIISVLVTMSICVFLCHRRHSAADAAEKEILRRKADIEREDTFRWVREQGAAARREAAAAREGRSRSVPGCLVPGQPLDNGSSAGAGQGRRDDGFQDVSLHDLSSFGAGHGRH